MPLIASSCFDCLSADPVKRIGLYPKSRRRRAIEAAELELRPVTRVTGRSLLRELLYLRTRGQSQREIEMAAEIFLLHLEATARGGKGSASVRAVESPLFKQRSWAVRTKQLTQAANRLMTHINAISARNGRVITTPLARS
jgi:hypothetical protein